ncbi:MAG TPA: hypothetical protein VFI54_14110 [Solirubrobacteraceae bacterium]|nr:hypothetical protein [Solirubrobacteraceae bacterium]
MEPELDRAGTGERAVRVAACHQDRVDVTLPASTKAGHRELLVSSQLVLDPGGAPATRSVMGVKALGNDPL